MGQILGWRVCKVCKLCKPCKRFRQMLQRITNLFFSPFPITFFVKSLEVTLYFTTFAASYPCQKPYGQRVGRHTYDIRRFCALWFWRSMNFANSNFLSRTKQQRTPHGVYCILPSLSSDALLHSLVGRLNYILTLTWGFRRCICVVHSKSIFCNCYLLDYQ